jgi:hypothetical protein
VDRDRCGGIRWQKVPLGCHPAAGHGSFDPSFGVGGHSLAGYSLAGGDHAQAVALDGMGRIVIVGGVTNNFSVERIPG